MQLHPIMYVVDQYAEPSFYQRFGFQRVYEGDEFPASSLLGMGKRSSACSAHRPNNRPTSMASAGSSS